MFTSPLVDVITILEDLRGRALMKPGPAENDTGGSGLKLRKSYTLTRGSGKGRD